MDKGKGNFHDLLMSIKVMFFSVLMCSVEITPKFLEALAPKSGGVKSWKYISKHHRHRLQQPSSSSSLILSLPVYTVQR